MSVHANRVILVRGIHGWVRWQGQAKRLRKQQEQQRMREAIDDAVTEQRASRLANERMFARLMGVTERATSILEELIARAPPPRAPCGEKGLGRRGRLGGRFVCLRPLFPLCLRSILFCTRCAGVTHFTKIHFTLRAESTAPIALHRPSFQCVPPCTPQTFPVDGVGPVAEQPDLTPARAGARFLAA